MFLEKPNSPCWFVIMCKVAMNMEFLVIPFHTCHQLELDMQFKRGRSETTTTRNEVSIQVYTR